MSATMIPWNDDFLIGIAELDNEHHDLLDRFNEYSDALIAEKGHAEVRKILGNIYARLEMHFALEERVMREFEYKNYQSHKAEHNAILNEFSEFIEAFKSDPTLEYEELVTEKLKRWIVGHILTSDKKMAEMIEYMTTAERERIGNFFNPSS